MSEKHPTDSRPATLQGAARREHHQRIYGLSPDQHEVLKKYPAKFLAKGGGHFVYEIGTEESGDLRDVVVKGDMGIAKKLRTTMQKSKIDDFNALPSELQEKIRENLKEETEKYLAMRNHFGSDHVMPQRKSIERVPITPAISEELFGKEAGAKYCWTLVTLQKRAKELNDPEATPMDIGAEYYQAEPGLDKRSSKLLEAANNDPELREVLKEFIEKTIDYSNKEKEILDLIGGRNVYFYQKQERDGTRHWSYRILDGFHAKPGQRDLEKAQVAVARFEETGTFQDGEGAGALLNPLAYARTIDAMAEQLGIPDRIDLLKDVPQEKHEDLIRELRLKLKSS